MKFKVAVYGSLKKDFENHHLMAGSKFLGHERIDGHAMYSLGVFPAAIKQAGSSIMTEIYEITAQTLTRMDMLEGHTGVRERSFYFREIVQTRFGATYLYVFQRDVSKKLKVNNGWW